MTARGAVVMVVIAAAVVLVYLQSHKAADGGTGPTTVTVKPAPNAFSGRDRVLAAGGSRDGAGSGALSPMDAPPQTRGDALGAGLKI